MSKNFLSFRNTIPIVSILFFIIIYSFFNIYYSNVKIIDDSSSQPISHKIEISSSFAWPVPGCNIITSYFGYRIAPTAGATSYHSGLDIGAPTGSYLVAICDGQITTAGWTGSGRLYNNSCKS